MSSDRELLELAARAAGVAIAEWVGSVPRLAGANAGYWEPLADDGDALRLMVACRIEVTQGRDCAQAGFVIAGDPADGTHDTSFCREYISGESDRLAATRRAIVRAAAEIGRGMP